MTEQQAVLAIALLDADIAIADARGEQRAATMARLQLGMVLAVMTGRVVLVV
jgi:hypothetical protein